MVIYLYGSDIIGVVNLDFFGYCAGSVVATGSIEVLFESC